MTHRHWISFIVAAAFAALLIRLASLNRVNAARAEASAQAVAHSYAVTAELAETLSTLVDAETGQRGFVITGEDRYLQPYESAVAAVQQHLGRLAQLTADNPQQQGDIVRARELTADKLAELGETIRVRRASGFAAAQAIVATDRGKQLMDDLRLVAARMTMREEGLLRERERDAQSSSARAWLASVATTAIAVFAVAAVWFGFRRHSLERTRAMAAIANEREYLRVTLLGLGDGVIVVDASGHVSMMNPIAETLTGFSQADAVGQHVSRVFNIVNEDTRRVVTNPLDIVLKTGTIQGLANHTVLIAADGIERPIDDSAAPIRGDDGSVFGAVLVFRDVSGRRANERRLRDALDAAHSSRVLAESRQHEVERALEIKNQFLAAVSHELRTPINAIVGWASQLNAGTVRPERTTAAVASIERNAQTLARLIEDLLESSRLLAGKVRLDSESLDFVAVVSEAIDAVRLSAENKGIALDVQTERGATIRGDAERLKQVVWNILGNAIKFTPSGGYSRHWTRDSCRDAPAPLRAVHSRRCTVAKRARPRAGHCEAAGRTHGGTIDASNNGSDGGATFVISIPTAASDVPASLL